MNQEIITLTELQNTVPKRIKKSITQDLVDTLNTLKMDKEEARIYRENILSYSHVLNEGKFRIKDYLSAVRYVGYVLGGMAKKEAYARVFPNRHAQMIANGLSNEEYTIRVSMYQNSKLVKSLKEQAMIPLYILNMEHRQLGINKLVEVLNNQATSPKVIVEAADTLLKHLTPPQQAIGLQINVDTASATSLISELKDTLDTIASQKKQEIIEHNGNVAKIANTTYLQEVSDD